jgi:alkylhydroperoxidase family enzyme
MAFIRYVSPDEIPPEHRVADTDNIVRIHGVHSETIRLHYDLYRELMRGPGPLTRVQREMVAVTVSATNGCHY